MAEDIHHDHIAFFFFIYLLTYNILQMLLFGMELYRILDAMPYGHLVKRTVDIF